MPEGWKVEKLTDLIKWESSYQPPKKDFIYSMKEGYVRFIQNRDYNSDGHKTYIPIKDNLTIVDKFDILMDKYGDAGRVRYGIEGAFNVALARINVKDPALKEYIRSYFESKPIYNYLHNSCMASTRASLSLNNLSSLMVMIPDKETLNSYEIILHNIRSIVLKNKEENEKLSEIKDFLLPLLMNGQATID
ncbi:restriction endonuclease subunit S [Mycoplasma sp. T158Tt]|uniref:Restriction endonuclease subunit S n=1 Tax=Mycoplasma bradburyae TaxID=2963128 RepID=A0AAW6HQS7_9MOLU|nr:restriction endonuclease subunit S [Mycoplasma bradburyae]MDC4183413.1 restriction endonuclease subunit S [Mycoplasma bradburyae]